MTENTKKYIELGDKDKFKSWLLERGMELARAQHPKRAESFIKGIAKVHANAMRSEVKRELHAIASDL